MINSISVLFVTGDPDIAGRVIGRIRFRGRAVRAKQAGNLRDIERLLQNYRFEAILLVDRELGIALSDLNEVLYRRGRMTPIIVMTDRPEQDRAGVLDTGAFAAVGMEYDDLAAALALKAVDHLSRSRELNHLRTKLQDADRRYLVMLDSSHYPIACFNRDTAIYANDAWRACFEIQLSESLETIQLPHLVAPDRRDELNALLSELNEQDESTEGFETLTLQTRNGHEFDADLVINRAIIDGDVCTVVHLSAAGCAALDEPHEPLRQARAAPGLGRDTSPPRAISQQRQPTPEAPSPRTPPTEPAPVVPEPTETQTPRTLKAAYPPQRKNAKQLLQTMESPLLSATDPDRTLGLALFLLDILDPENPSQRESLDPLIEQIGGLLDLHFPSPATVARFENGTYGVFLPTADRGKLESVLEDALSQAAKISHKVGNNETFSGALSCGAVLMDDSGPAAEELLIQAEQALAESRAEGGQRYRFYQPGDASGSRPDQDEIWKERIQNAIANDGLRLLYQPIMGLQGEDVPRYNVFVRLTGDQGKVYDPGEFLPAAERLGIAAPLDQWIIRHAVATLSQQLKTDPRTMFFVKLSHGSLDPEPVVHWLRKFLERSQVPASNVVVEFQEATLLTSLEAAAKTANDLRDLGVDLCVTDFGNGLDPFSVLARVDAAYVKLDPGLLEDLARNADSRETLAQLTAKAREGGCQVIVPFVETAQTLAVLFTLNVNLVQGYLIQAPSEQPTFDFAQGL
jgi:EAL domain-containing protein (putative c-di-GMP-specific phosphodiesterase class I)/GGDEF domain-containing protein/PAS domain-containing protein